MFYNTGREEMRGAQLRRNEKAVSCINKLSIATIPLSSHTQLSLKCFNFIHSQHHVMRDSSQQPSPLAMVSCSRPIIRALTPSAQRATDVEYDESHQDGASNTR